METCADDAKETTILQVVSALSLALVGVLGTVLNILVILGVLGNARLGTTVNKLLIWICTFALLEATLGITMKALILGGVMQRNVTLEHNEMVCKLFLVMPFTFSNVSTVMWTTVSVYRLYLVVSSARGKTNQLLQSHHKHGFWTPHRVLPFIALCLGLITSLFNAIWAEPFVLYRVCRGMCDDFDVNQDNWAAAFLIVVALLYHVPSGVCYVLIYCFLKIHHARSQKHKDIGQSLASPGQMAMTFLRVPTSVRTRLSSLTAEELGNSTNSDNSPRPGRKKLWSSSKAASNDIAMVPLQASQVQDQSKLNGGGVRTNGSIRKETPRQTEIEINATDKIESNPQRRASSVMSASDMPRPALSQRSASTRQPRAKARVKKKLSFSEPRTTNTLQVPRVHMAGRRTGEQSGSDCSSHENLSISNVVSAPPEIQRSPIRDSIIPEIRTDNITGDTTCLATDGDGPAPSGQDSGQRRRRRRRRTNVISAKLGFIFLVLSSVFFLLIHFGYSRVPERWQKKLVLRAFVNALVFDCVICVISPLLLLYGSKELRKSISNVLWRVKCTAV